MADLLPLRGLRYDAAAGDLGDLICPPYDVIATAQRERLLARSAQNFVRVELPDPTPRGHAAASDELRRWIREGVLRPEPQDALYVDEHTFRLAGESITRTEVLVALRLYELSAGVVLPHEHTFPKAKQERLELLRATRANTSPIFGMFSDDEGAVGTLRRAAAAATAVATTGDEGHRLAVIADRTAIDAFRRAVADQPVFIADGHHRYETALSYANERRAGEADPERYVLAALCALDDPGLRILATHRIVSGALTELDAAIARSFDTAPADHPSLGDADIVVVRDGRLTRLRPRAGADLSGLPVSWRTLPVAIAEELLLKDAHAVGATVTYEHDLDTAIAAAHGATTAILLGPVRPATLRAVAGAGERMPQKTTYFYPKVPAGLVVRSLDLG